MVVSWISVDQFQCKTATLKQSFNVWNKMVPNSTPFGPIRVVRIWRFDSSSFPRLNQIDPDRVLPNEYILISVISNYKYRLLSKSRNSEATILANIGIIPFSPMIKSPDLKLWKWGKTSEISICSEPNQICYCWLSNTYLALLSNSRKW